MKQALILYTHHHLHHYVHPLNPEVHQTQPWLHLAIHWLLVGMLLVGIVKETGKITFFSFTTLQTNINPLVTETSFYLVLAEYERLCEVRGDILVYK